MAGETDLRRLLTGLDPFIHDEDLVYASLAGDDAPADVLAEAFALVREDEGVTLILAEDAARRHGLEGEFRCRRIELRVRSDLAAVGLTAAVARALTDVGISANVVAAFHHDHVLVPADRVEDAVAALRRLAADPG